MKALLDVNVLVALFDPMHEHHAAAFGWWTANRDQGWATCPLTQNGFVRVISSASYPRPLRLADAVALLQAQVSQPGHVFWPDDVALVDTAYFDHHHLRGPSQITDAYLLALAIHHGGRLVTFDRAISLQVVRSARTEQLVVL